MDEKNLIVIVQNIIDVVLMLHLLIYIQGITLSSSFLTLNLEYYTFGKGNETF